MLEGAIITLQSSRLVCQSPPRIETCSLTPTLSLPVSVGVSRPSSPTLGLLALRNISWLAPTRRSGTRTSSRPAPMVNVSVWTLDQVLNASLNQNQDLYEMGELELQSEFPESELWCDTNISEVKLARFLQPFSYLFIFENLCWCQNFGGIFINSVTCRNCVFASTSSCTLFLYPHNKQLNIVTESHVFVCDRPPNIRLSALTC